MNVVDIHNVTPGTRITSVGDTAMFLNLFFHDAVEELLESFTDFTDFDIIAELVDSLNLRIIAVIEPVNGPGVLVHGYINNEVVA